MQIMIDIPKEFESHFDSDRFNDSLHRLSADAHFLAGNYEQETIKMLAEAFQNAVIISDTEKSDIEKLSELKKGDTILVKCKVEAVFVEGGMVMVSTRDCDEGFDAYIDEIA